MYVTISDTTSESSSMSELLLIDVLSPRPYTAVEQLALSSSMRTPGRSPTTETTTTSSAFHPNLVVTSPTSSDASSNWTESSITASADIVGVQLPVGVVIVIVLAAACVVLGAIYGYIYFTRIGPESAAGSTSGKTRKTTGGGLGSDRDHHHGGDSGHEDGSPDAPFTYTHVFLFRKPSTHHRAATIT